MTSTTWGWLLSTAGTAASVVGVLFSWLAWKEAGKAKDAAQQAANAVRIRNLAQSFSRWAVDARDLLSFVREQEFANAQRSATDLFGALSHNRGWQAGLQREASALDEIVRLLNLVNAFLTDEIIFREKQADMAEYCQAIYKKLSELTGALDAQAERS
jgi:hypothetical protein